MRAALQAWLNGVWYRRRAPPPWLMPLSALYGAIVLLRRRVYARGWRRVRRVSCPVVVVGNLTVGGTGKTPLVCWLAARLAERGFRPGIVSRGYGGSAGGVRRVSPTADPAVVGDEAVLLARRGLAVAIGADRPAAARLLTEAGCDVVISDDGLQHHALHRDCELIVMDAARGFGNGWLLPAGPLREPPARARRADALIVNGEPCTSATTLCMRLEADCAIALHGGASKPLRAFAGTAVNAIAGIGNPARFFDMLRAAGIEVCGRALADHAAIDALDLQFGDDKSVLMTEKDAVKCAGLGDARHWYVPVTASFAAAAAAALLDTVVARLRGAGIQREES